MFLLGASRGHRPPNVILGPPAVISLLSGGKLNFKMEIDIVKYSGLLIKFVPTNKSANINLKNLL